jgi:hypothetical protein
MLFKASLLLWSHCSPQDPCYSIAHSLSAPERARAITMDATLPKTSRPKRKSIAHQPSSATNSKSLDNATADIASLQRAEGSAAAKKKLRGKSLGPGGIEALKESTGNILKVWQSASGEIGPLLTLSGRGHHASTIDTEADGPTHSTKSDSFV